MKAKRVTKKTPVEKAKPKPVIAQKEVTRDEDRISSITYEGEKIVTKEEARQLLDLQGSYGPKITWNHVENLYNILMMIRIYGFSMIYRELQESKNTDDYIFQQMKDSKRNFMLRLIQGMIQDPSQTGIFECKRCKREGREPNETTAQVKERRGDEPPVVLVTCNTCGNQWRE